MYITASTTSSYAALCRRSGAAGTVANLRCRELGSIGEDSASNWRGLGFDLARTRPRAT